MASVRDWLQLFRAQTAPATVMPLVIGAVLAGAPVWLVAYVWLVGVFLHFASFGHNSVMDYLMGFDREDPSKRHHPLPSGRIRPSRAAWVIHAMLLATLTAMIAPFVASDSWLGAVFLLLYAVLGYAYNNGLDHLTEWSWVPISLCFAFAAPLGFLVAGEPHGPLAWWTVAALWAWGFTVVAYQIAFEGNLKDIPNPGEVNALKSLCRVAGVAGGDHVIECASTLKWMWAVRLTSYLIAFMIGLAYHSNIAYLAVLTAAFAYLSWRLHTSMLRGARGDLLERMGRQEVSVYYHLLLALLPLSPAVLGVLAVFGIAWFVAMNRVLWGSRMGPRV